MKVKNTRIYLIIHLYKEFTYVTGISHHCSLFINSTFCHLPNLALTKARKNCLPEARLGLFQHHRSCSGPLVLLTHTTDVFYLCGISVSTKSPTIGWEKTDSPLATILSYKKIPRLHSRCVNNFEVRIPGVDRSRGSSAPAYVIKVSIHFAQSSNKFINKPSIFQFTYLFAKRICCVALNQA